MGECEQPEHDTDCIRNGVLLEVPDCVRENLPRTSVMVDSCIADEVAELWGRRVVTLGSCCGHGTDAPSLVLGNDQDVARAAQLLRLIDIERKWRLYQWQLVEVAPLPAEEDVK